MEGRKNSPFTKEKETWIILKFVELKSLTSVRRLFRKEFNMNPKDLPTCKTFSRVIERFKETGNVQPRKSPGEVILHSQPVGVPGHVGDCGVAQDQVCQH